MARTSKKQYISYDNVTKIVDTCNQKGIEIDVFEGTLLDNYLIYANYKIQLNKLVPRKYIIIEAMFINSNQSMHTFVQTDNQQLVDEFLQRNDPMLEQFGEDYLH